MGQKIVVILLLIAGVAWMEQDWLKTQWQKYTSKINAPQNTQNNLYTWKDEDGTVHFSATPDNKNAKLTTVDTSKISRLEPLPAEQKQQEPKQDKLLLLQMREELEHNRNVMQAEKERRIMQH